MVHTIIMVHNGVPLYLQSSWCYVDLKLFALLSIGWRGGLAVGRRTCDLVVAGSRPGRDAAV